MANHLLARYDAPLFMGRAWFDEGPTARRGRQWFLHLARGGNIRSMDTEIHLIQRMAHLFPQAPSNLTIPMALRWAQCQGMGASRGLTKAVVRSRLRYFMEDEPFWATVVLFLVNHSMLEPTHVGPIVDYLYNQKFVPRETEGPDGQIIRGAPPQPHLVMKGRSIDKLLRQVEGWHRELAMQKTERWVEWTSCGIGGFVCEEQDEESGDIQHCRIVELRNARDLAREGSMMHHCIYSYRERCASGDASAFSLQVQAGEARPLHVLTIAVDNGQRVVTEFRGKYNMRPNETRPISKKRQLRQDYKRLLNQSSKVMERWMAQEGLRAL